jgi:hypothetical protein
MRISPASLVIPNMFVNDTNPGPLNPPSLGDFERVGSPRIGGWGAVRHLYHSLEYLVLASLVSQFD